MKIQLSQENKPLTIFSYSSLTDIVLLLLIFFLLTSSFIITEGIQVTLPEAKHTTASEQEQIVVALLNDGKYGHDTLDNMLSLTLLKAPLAPDPLADRGEHTFTYALLPHLGAFTAEEVVREAYNLNVPLSYVKANHGPADSKALRFCSVSNPNVVIETIKKAEESNAVIVRFYEAGNTRGQTTLTFGRRIREACECNLLEDGETPVKTRRNSVSVSIAPFEIKTIRVVFQ